MQATTRHSRYITSIFVKDFGLEQAFVATMAYIFS